MLCMLDRRVDSIDGLELVVNDDQAAHMRAYHRLFCAFHELWQDDAVPTVVADGNRRSYQHRACT